MFSGEDESSFAYGEITGLAACINFYGIIDLQEVLSNISRDINVTLSDTRPLKIKHWLKVIILIKTSIKIIK